MALTFGYTQDPDSKLCILCSWPTKKSVGPTSKTEKHAGYVPMRLFHADENHSSLHQTNLFVFHCFSSFSNFPFPGNRKPRKILRIQTTMAANACISPATSSSSSHPLNSPSALQRSFSFSSSRLYLRRGIPNQAPKIILTVRSAARDGRVGTSGSKRSPDPEVGAGPIGSSVSLSSPLHSSSSIIDFLTLCHRLKVLRTNRSVSLLHFFFL